MHRKHEQTNFARRCYQFPYSRRNIEFELKSRGNVNAFKGFKFRVFSLFNEKLKGNGQEKGKWKLEEN